MTQGISKMAAMAAMACLVAGCEVRESAQPAEPATNAANPAAAAAPSADASKVPLAKAAADPGLQWGPCPEGMPEGCGIAVLHGDPAKPNADIFLRVPGGSAIPPHSHSSAERMILVGGELEAKYQGADALTLRPGHYAYGPAKLPHRAQCRSSEPCILFIAFEGPVDLLPFEGAI
ncbi:MAG TPA: cupin domain-containing protein [Sphingomicrobium sp.]|nr:cupin domain-containing protein [Sphingomicrobium sp.]